jgi:HD superfamily phosphodiesterase
MMEDTMQELILLLQRMAVGATIEIYHPDSWAAYLGDTSMAKTFITQLRTEWFPVPAVDALSRRIGEQCRQHMTEWNSGWPNLWAHTLRVAGYAMYLAPSVNLPIEYAYLLAVLHDVGKFDEIRDGIPHEVIAGSYARTWLGDEFPREVVTGIAKAVEKEGRSSDPFVRLLYDSDKLEKIGASGIVRRVSQVVTLPNALDAIRRVENDLRRFPTMKLDAARAIAERKEAFTEAFIAEVQLLSEFTESISG